MRESKLLQSLNIYIWFFCMTRSLSDLTNSDHAYMSHLTDLVYSVYSPPTKHLILDSLGLKPYSHTPLHQHLQSGIQRAISWRSDTIWCQYCPGSIKGVQGYLALVLCHLIWTVMLPILQWKWLQEWRCECEWQWGSHLLLTLLTPFPLPPHHCHCKPQRQRIYFLYIFFMTDCILTECWLFLWSLCDVFKLAFLHFINCQPWNLTTFVAQSHPGEEIFLHSCKVTLWRMEGCDILHEESDSAIFARGAIGKHIQGMVSSQHWQEKDWISVCNSCPTLQQCKSVLWSLHCDLFVVNFAPRLLIVHWRPVRQ